MGANPNTVSPGIQETWDKSYQVTHHKIPVYPVFTNFRLAPGLQKGDTVHREYRNKKVAKVMGANGSYSTQALVDTDESLVVDQEYESSFYLKELDEIQNHLPTRAKHAYDSNVAIFQKIDATILGLATSYSSSLDAADFSGTAGEGIDVDVSNIRSIFTKAQKKMQRQNILIDNSARFTGFRQEDSEKQMGVAIISPDIYQVVLEYLDGKDSALGDKVALNGNAGQFMGFNLHISNSHLWTADLVLATLPTNNDTAVINGATLTFVTGTPTNPGDVKAVTDAATSLANLVASINAPYTSVSGTFVALSDANAALLNGITATNATTKITFRAEGAGYLTVSETLTAAADIWTLAKQISHIMIGTNNSADAVIQKTPSLRIKDAPSAVVGYDFITWSNWGRKVFNENLYKMVDVKVKTSGY